MIAVRSVLIAPEALEYLRKRGLEDQYLKAKRLILAGFVRNASLKLREPKRLKTWYFRINRQFRAICDLRDGILFVLAIDNHQ